MSKQIPFVSFAGMSRDFRDEALAEFEAFFDSMYYVLGPGVTAFEAAYAEFNQTEHCIGVSNGLEAIHMALRALGVGEGDEVIVPSHTYIATALAVTYTGATVVFVEPNEDTFNVEAAAIAAAITERTKAIIPVHLYGQACVMDPIMELAERHGIPVIEDNAQSQGATYRDRLTGTFGALNATSFYPGKNLGALGDAGAVTTNDAELAKVVTTLRNYGSERKYYNDRIGYNARIDEVQARMLTIKLRYLDKWNADRRRIAARYDAGLAGVSGVTTPHIAPGATSVYHLYVIKTDRRDELAAHLKAHGVATLIHYPVPIHRQEAYAHLGYGPGSFPVAERLADTILSLPLYPGLPDEDVDFVISCIKDFYA